MNKEYETNGKALFDGELIKTKRDNIKELIECMEDGGFYESPCSGAHHLAEPGGLLEHSLNVLTLARDLARAWESTIPEESITISALLHDLGKMGDHGKPNYAENYLKDGSRSSAKPYITNTNLVYIPHEVRSVLIAERYIYLSEEEERAILWHNGLYGQFKNDITGKETELYMIIHFADMWASRITEKEEE
jgi:putative nucleotidyltransferase with HDIG domain